MSNVNLSMSSDDYNSLINYLITLENVYYMNINHNFGYLPCDNPVTKKLDYNKLINLRDNFMNQLHY